MRKLFLALFAILFVVGVANATNIPSTVDPENSAEIWITSVYNYTGSGATEADVGDVVCWDIDNSTDDNKNWVIQCATADTTLVAGVVYQAAIKGGDVGTIAIKGPVQTDCIYLQTVDGPACSSATAGSATSCAEGSYANADAMFGFVTGACSSNSGVVYVNVN